MSSVLLPVIYLLFFLSGASALIYQVVWVRSLTLVFGGSHLAVTAVLSMFMGGLALGGYVVGRRADRVANPLRLYGFLELGIAASALAFAGLMQIYPSVYVALAQGRDAASLSVTLVRMLFSVVALIVPTALMGGTLPFLSRLVSRQPEDLRSRLSFLYGFNTLGAVLGALLAGFVLLRFLSVTATLFVAIAINIVIGAVSLVLQRNLHAVRPAEDATRESPAAALPPVDADDVFRVRLVLWGIGISGFCALGYEVLWTRVLTLAIGSSVYGFTIILVAFLTGIALGSKAHGVLLTVFRIATPRTRGLIAWFGITQVLVGLSALVVTVYLRDVAVNAVRLQSYFLDNRAHSFEARAWAGFTLAFLYMLVPALFLGAAFPLAGQVVAKSRRAVGQAVGEVLASNTVGAIFGAAVAGLVLVRVFGIERSLQLLTVVNIGLGLTVLASLRKSPWAAAPVATFTLGVLAFLASSPETARVWDRKYFAIFRSNQPEAFRTPEMIREAVENTDVLFYAEGVESTVSVIRVKGGEQAFLTNGRVEASTHLQAQQNQFTLGHLPMLLNPNPREVLVIGMGSGMTAGATAVHPGVERVTVVEIEPQVFGVAATFAEYNHDILNHPRLDTVVNDGRNFLLTTARTFDVITADPIHPWFRGAGYLYSSEYFELAAKRLRRGGVVAQWLPIYELTAQDLASIVRTFQQHFAHTMMWLTHYDATIVGSNSPFVIDENELDRRIAHGPVAKDLRRVAMGSAADLLSYFVMGTPGMKRFALPGTVNTDDHLSLEFSAPFSIATASVMSANVEAMAAHRENLLPYLKPAAGAAAREEQRDKCDAQLAAGKLADPTLALFLERGAGDPILGQSIRRLNLEYPWYAPARFLASEFQTAVAMEPRLLERSSFPMMDEAGGKTVFEMSAVLVPVSRSRASIMFVDNRARMIYGQLYMDDYEQEARARRLAVDVMTAVRAAYEDSAIAARVRNRDLPPAAETLQRIRAVIGSKVRNVQPVS